MSKLKLSKKVALRFMEEDRIKQIMDIKALILSQLSKDEVQIRLFQSGFGKKDLETTPWMVEGFKRLFYRSDQKAFALNAHCGRL